MPNHVVPARIKKKIQREVEAKTKSSKAVDRSQLQNGKTEDEVEEEEIFNPLCKPEFEVPLKWLKDVFVNEIGNRDYDPYWDQPGTHDILLKKTEENKFAFERPEFLKLLKWLMFEEPDGKHDHWFIPKYLTREELVLGSKMIKNMLHSNDILNSKDIDFAKCKGCGYDYAKLRLHLNKNLDCRGKYSENDMEELEEIFNYMTKARKSDWYLKNKDSCSNLMAKYHQENRGKILKRKKTMTEGRKKAAKKNL